MKPAIFLSVFVFGVGVLALCGLATLEAAPSSGPYSTTTYGGYDKLGGNVVINYSASQGKTGFYAYHVPLNQQTCPGEYTTLFMPDVDVTSGSFDEFDGVNGANGVYAPNDHGNPGVTGTIYVRQTDECANAVPYVGGTLVALQGDYDCSWLQQFQVQSDGQPQGPAPIPNPLDGIDLNDMLAYLKAIAKANATPTASPTASPVPPVCPKPDDKTPAGVAAGDADCDGAAKAKDVLHIINLELGIDPPPSTGPSCIRVGKFYLLDK